MAIFTWIKYILNDFLFDQVPTYLWVFKRVSCMCERHDNKSKTNQIYLRKQITTRREWLPISTGNPKLPKELRKLVPQGTQSFKVDIMDSGLWNY